MKKIILFLATIIAIVLTSCTKSDAPTTEKFLKLNLKIAAPETESKAMKTSWTVGDKLNIWFNENEVGHENPDLIIRYDGVNWTSIYLRPGANIQIGNGKMNILYEGYNNIGSYEYNYVGTGVDIGDHYKMGKRLVPEESEYSFTNSLLICNNNVSYEYDGETLTTTITSGWVFHTKLKVLIKDLASAEANNYQLIINGVNGLINPNPISEVVVQKYNGPSTGVHVLTPSPITTYPGPWYKIWAGGAPDADGVAFYFGSTLMGEDCHLVFTLYKYDGMDLVSTNTYTLNDLKNEIDATDNTCKGVYIKKEKFGL